jgi:hypothetical protein
VLAACGSRVTFPNRVDVVGDRGQATPVQEGGEGDRVVAGDTIADRRRAGMAARPAWSSQIPGTLRAPGYG